MAHALTPPPDEPAGPAAAVAATAPGVGAVIRAVPPVRKEPVRVPEAPDRPAAEPVAGAARGPASEPVPEPVSEPVSEVEAGAAAPPRRRRATGARERKRQETRARIVDAAAVLFAQRGFDAVSVMEIAQKAGVVEKTVFNHFPMKEGLVFDADPPMRDALLDAVRRRPAGESVAAAAGSFVVSAVALLGTPEAASGVADIARVVRGSRTLQVREREILGEFTAALAALIAEETGARPGEIEPWLAANAVLGLYASLLELARDRVLAGMGGAELSAELRRQGRRGLALLQFGLAGYAKTR